MTNEEKIQDLLNEPCWNSKPYLIGMDRIGVEDVMERFAEWKDEQHAQEKQQWIDKACKIISDKVENYINFYGDDDYGFDKQGFIKRFKKAMKGEE